MAAKAARPSKKASTSWPPRDGAPAMRRSRISKPGSATPSGSSPASRSTLPIRSSGGRTRPGAGCRMGLKRRNRWGRRRFMGEEYRIHFMKHVLSLLLALLLLSAAASAQLPPSLTAPPAAKDPAAVATELIDRLAKGDFQAAASNFAGIMRTMAPPEKLSEIWASLQAQMGPYERRTGVRTQQQEAYEMVLVPTEFQRSTVDFKVLVDDKGQIAGFFIVGSKPRL